MGYVAQGAEEERTCRGEQVTHPLGHARKRCCVLKVWCTRRKEGERQGEARPYPKRRSTTQRTLATLPATSKPRVPAPESSTPLHSTKSASAADRSKSAPA
jgi:hypothetical protein